MHTMHNASTCIYSPRHKFGFGVADGENLERLWSFLGRFSSKTKEMSPANRTDSLSDAMLHYASKKSPKLGIHSIQVEFFTIVSKNDLEVSIVERIKRAHALMTSSDVELPYLLELCGIIKSEIDTVHLA